MLPRFLRRRGPSVDDPFAAETTSWSSIVERVLLHFILWVFGLGGFVMFFAACFFFMITEHITKGTKYGWRLWVGASMFFLAFPLMLLVARICSPYQRRHRQRIVDRQRRREELLASNKVIHAMPAPMTAMDPSVPTEEVRDVEMDLSNIPVAFVMEGAPEDEPIPAEEEKHKVILEKEREDVLPPARIAEPGAPMVN